MIKTVLAALALVAVAMSQAQAQEDYPSRPVTIVVPYAPGGATDNVGRILAQELQKKLGQSFVVENRAGASGITAANYVAQAEPDGYTLMIGTSGSLTINVQMMKTPPFDPLKAFDPVSLLVINDGVLIVSPDFPANNVEEFVAAVKAAPGKYSFASSGTGGPTHLAGELIKKEIGLDMVHVPYKGDGPAFVDVIAGRVPIHVTVMASAAPQIDAHAVKPIAALGEKRFPKYPDLPTLSETYPGLTGGAWLSLIGPAGMPEAVVAKLSKATNEILADPAVIKRLDDLGSRAQGSTPAELHDRMEAELKRWGAIIEEIGLKGSQ